MEKNQKELNHYAVHLKLTQYCKSTLCEFKKKKKDELTVGFLSVFVLFVYFCVLWGGLVQT